MGANTSKPVVEQTLRYRVTVPMRDADVINWMAEQHNVSFSIRMLIKAAIAKYGLSDVTCLSMNVGLDMDLEHLEAERQPPKKTGVSLKEVRKQQAQMQEAQASVRPTAQPVAAPAPPVAPPVARPIQKPAAASAPMPGMPAGYVPTDINDLM